MLGVLTVKMLAGAASSEGKTGAGGAISRMASSYGCSREASASLHVACPQCRLSVLTVWLLALPTPQQLSPERAGRSHMSFMIYLQKSHSISLFNSQCTFHLLGSHLLVQPALQGRRIRLCVLKGRIAELRDTLNHHMKHTKTST